MQRSLSAPSPFSPGKSSPASEVGRRSGHVSSPFPSKGLQNKKKNWQNLGPLGRAGEELLSSPAPVKCGFLLDGTGPLLVGGEEPGSRARLVHHGPSELWARHSSKHVVRDLLAGYAADPLAPGPRRATCGSASSSNAGSPRNDPGAARQCFLERYVRQQAHIEHLLRGWKPPPPRVAVEDEQPEKEESSAIVEEVAAEEVVPPEAVNTFFGTEISFPLQVASKTRNVTIDKDIMTCTERSGGARFLPPDAETFRLSVRSLDPLDTHPFYIGMVPAGADPTEVGFFKREEGIFLRVGGYPPGREAIDGHPLLRKDPNRPEFTVFGERSLASVSSTTFPRMGCGVAVHFYQSFPRDVIVTEKIQCTECNLLVANTEEFAEHCFSSADTEGHGEDFGFHSCRRVELVEEGDYVTDKSLCKSCIRFQVENTNDRKGPAANAVPRSKLLSKGVPPLPREMPELVGGRPIFGPDGPWQPCVLLCTPGSRVQVQWLKSGAPDVPPKPTEIRLPAKPKA